MKSNLLIIGLLFIFSLCSAQNFSISNVVFDPPSPATLIAGQRVNITFDYTKTGGDIRIFARSWFVNGSGNGIAQSAGSPTYTDDNGSGEAYFFYTNDAKTDNVRFRFQDLDNNILYDSIIPVDYTYIGYNIKDLNLKPSSPGFLNVGDSIKFDFNFSFPEVDVKIVPMGIANDQVMPKQTVSISPTYTEEAGNGSGFISLDTAVAIDQIRFQFLDATTNDTLSEFFSDVYFVFSDDNDTTYTISNVVFNPPTPGLLTVGDSLKLTFDYKKPIGKVLIFAYPIYDEGSGNYRHSGSARYSDKIGSGNYYFIFTGEAKIKGVKFSVQSENYTIIHEHIEPCSFTFSNDPNATFSISDVVLTPPSPDTLNTGDTIKINFKYTKPFGQVDISVRPMENGQVKVGSESPSLGTFSAESGLVETYILFDTEATFDQIRFQMKSGPSNIVHQTFVDVDYKYVTVPFSLSDLSITPASPDSINIGDSINISFIYKNLNEQARLFVTPMANGQELFGYESSSPFNLLNNSDEVKTYLIFVDAAKIDQIKLQIIIMDDGTKSTSNTVIYEQLIDVNYVYQIPTNAGLIKDLAEPVVYPVPAHNELNIVVPAESFEYSIVSINGQILLNGVSNSTIKKIDISKYKNGIYITKINYQDIHYSKVVVFK